MNDAAIPVGERLFSILSDDPSKVYSLTEMATIGTLVDETIKTIQDFRLANGFSKNLKNQALVVGLFKNFDESDNQKKLRVTAQCAEEFLCWCRREIARGNSGVCQLLLNFTYDTTYIGYLGRTFNTRSAGRSHFWIPVDSYMQVVNWFRGGAAPRRLTSEFMCIFELRQAMETAFHRVIGLGRISVPLRIPHALIPAILHRCLTTENFSPPSGLTIKDFMHVYDWTDRSIHLMCTDWVWTVWKAMEVGCEFFTCPDRNIGQVSIHDNFLISEALLKRIRGQFVEAVTRQNSRFEEFDIEWVKPDAAIVDGNNGAIAVERSVEHVTLKRHRILCGWLTTLLAKLRRGR